MAEEKVQFPLDEGGSLVKVEGALNFARGDYQKKLYEGDIFWPSSTLDSTDRRIFSSTLTRLFNPGKSVYLLYNDCDGNEDWHGRSHELASLIAYNRALNGEGAASKSVIATGLVAGSGKIVADAVAKTPVDYFLYPKGMEPLSDKQEALEREISKHAKVKAVDHINEIPREVFPRVSRKHPSWLLALVLVLVVGVVGIFMWKSIPPPPEDTPFEFTPIYKLSTWQADKGWSHLRIIHSGGRYPLGQALTLDVSANSEAILYWFMYSKPADGSRHQLIELIQASNAKRYLEPERPRQIPEFPDGILFSLAPDESEFILLALPEPNKALERLIDDMPHGKIVSEDPDHWHRLLEQLNYIDIRYQHRFTYQQGEQQ